MMLAKADSLPHISCVRGSPLFRTLLILVVVVASGFLFVRLTAAPKVEVVNVPVEDAVVAAGEGMLAKVYLTLSGKADKVAVEGAGGAVDLWETASGTFSGEVEIAGDSPVLSVMVNWLQQGADHRFAKLVVEAPGKGTFTRVFDSPGDIDDFVELPF